MGKANWTLAATLCVTMLLTLPVSDSAFADPLETFQPNPQDLYDLDHYSYYKWGFTVDGYSPAAPITSAQIILKDIYDWQAEPNQLYIHLLDWAPTGVTVFSDQDGGSDTLAGQGILLKTYVNLPTTPQTLVYDLTTPQLATLNQYLANGGNMGIGFDPDCHFYNNGITFQLSYPPSYLLSQVPEPGTVALVGTGLLGGIGVLYRRRMK